MLSASVIADSINDEDRLTTIEATMHRFVLAEFNTHRVFSRNSASSRAIPVDKQIARVLGMTAYPVEFGTNQPGMQAGPPLTGTDLEAAQGVWWDAARAAVDSVRKLQELGVHKQVANRLLEPFMWHTVIVTSTEWENFFHQRCSPLAQPEMRCAAELIQEAYNSSTPKFVGAGEWHTPYIQPDEQHLDWEHKKRISAARCARVSYLTQDGERDHGEDLKLFARLVEADPPHASPLEHVATPFEFDHYRAPQLGNFDGWLQLRHAATYDR